VTDGLSNILAAIGRGQLQVLAERVRRKREIFKFYADTIGDLPGITPGIRDRASGIGAALCPAQDADSWPLPPALWHGDRVTRGWGDGRGCWLQGGDGLALFCAAVTGSSGTSAMCPGLDFVGQM